MKEKRISSQEIVLTDEYMSMLERCTTKFKHTDTDRQEKIVKQAANNIKKTWQEDTEFNREATINVCEPSARPGPSHIFIAHLQTFVWQN